MFVRFPTICLAAWLATMSYVAADEFRLIDEDQVREKFENSITLLNENISSQDPPAYILKNATVELSVTNGVDGSISGKIPIGVVGASFSGEYSELTTNVRTYTYTPRNTVPTNFDDLGVLSFLIDLQKDAANTMNGMGLTSAKYAESFVAGINGEGKLEFFGLLSLGAEVSVKNSHKMVFVFCLQGADGGCI